MEQNDGRKKITIIKLGQNVMTIIVAHLNLRRTAFSIVSKCEKLMKCFAIVRGESLTAALLNVD